MGLASIRFGPTRTSRQTCIQPDHMSSFELAAPISRPLALADGECGRIPVVNAQPAPSRRGTYFPAPPPSGSHPR